MTKYQMAVMGVTAGEVHAARGAVSLATVVAQAQEVARAAEVGRRTVAEVAATIAVGQAEFKHIRGASDAFIASVHRQAERSAALFRSAEMAAARRRVEEAAAAVRASWLR